MPAGLTATYMSVVQGASMKPTRGQMNVSKAADHLCRLEEAPDEDGEAWTEEDENGEAQHMPLMSSRCNLIDVGNQGLEWNVGTMTAAVEPGYSER